MAVDDRFSEAPPALQGWSPPAGPGPPNEALRAVVRLALGLALAVGVGVAFLVADWRASAPQGEEVQTFVAGGGAPAVPAALASLWVDAAEPGAVVLVDGDSAGTTPLWIEDVRPGRRHVAVLGRDRALADTTLDVEAGGLAELAVGFGGAAPPPREPEPLVEQTVVERPTTGALRVSSTPAGAAVTLNGRTVGTTPLVLDGLAPGRHSVAVTRPGHDTAAEWVEVQAGVQSEAVFGLTAQTGGIEVLVRPWGTVAVNGEVRQRETDVVYRAQLPVGTHTVQASHPVLGSAARQVTVSRGAVSRLVFDLDAAPADAAGGEDQP